MNIAKQLNFPFCFHIYVYTFAKLLIISIEILISFFLRKQLKSIREIKLITVIIVFFISLIFRQNGNSHFFIFDEMGMMEKKVCHIFRRKGKTNYAFDETGIHHWDVSK